MYAAYYGLKREPFSIAPDPRLLFMSEQHREALAHLLYGVQGGGGFVLLTGEIGTGKTTLCRLFLEQVPASCQLAYIFNPRLTVCELLESVCHEFGVAVPPRGAEPPTVKALLDPLNAFLLEAHAAGRSSVLVIDEAQNLAPDVLEQLRLLTNLETQDRKLLQVILIGQPELRTLLARPGLEQLAQRVIARYHLQALSAPETLQYMHHRMQACGLQGPLPFDAQALRRIHALAGGVPRRINLLCDRALLGAYADGEPRVTRAIVLQAASEVFGASRRLAAVTGSPALRAGLAGLVLGAGLLASLQGVLLPLRGTPAAAPAAAAAEGATASALAGASDRSADAPPGGRPGMLPPVATAAGAMRVRALAQSPAAPRSDSSAADAAPAPAHGAGTPPEPAAPMLLRDEQQAWRELAALWRVEAAGPDACATLAGEAVQCFRQKLPLALVRALGRPGIVTLDAATGQPSYALLTGLGAGTATLRAGTTQQTVTLAALAQRWDGEFATLWRTPPGPPMRVADGQRGPWIDWLAARLASVLALPPLPAVYDGALQQQVRTFQTAHGLTADGRAGPLTFMQLNRASGRDEPRLHAAP